MPKADKPKATLIIDSREQSPWKFSKQVDTIRVGLPNLTGDYSILGLEPRKVDSKLELTGTIVIERKNIDDWVGTIVPVRKALQGSPEDNRLKFFKKLENLANCQEAWILFEFNANDILNHGYYSRRSPNNIRGLTRSAILTCAGLGIPVLFVSNPRTAANWAENILVNFWKKFGE